MFKRFLNGIFLARSQKAAGAGEFATHATFDVEMAEATRRFHAREYGPAELIAEAVVQRHPNAHQAWNTLGAIAAATGQYAQAVRHFERAIEFAPGNAEYLSNCGEACRRAGWLDDAADHCRASLMIDPAHYAGHFNLGLALHAMGEVDQAIAEIKQALAIQPQMRAARSALLFMLCHLPDADAAAVLAEHRRWNDFHAQGLAGRAPLRPRARAQADKLRVGFVSGDFRRHALSNFIAPLFSHYDRASFKFYCYSNTRRVDEVTAQLRDQVDEWRDITTVSDAAVADLVALDGVDILIDLSGHTSGSRILVFARKPAPVQVAYVGYPNTTGLTAMDYRITDAYVDPPGVADAMYTEKLLRMPHSLWCYRPPIGTPAVNVLPALERGRPTFGSLHRFTKLNKYVIDLWARLLARVPSSELIVGSVPTRDIGARLLDSLAAQGIDTARVHLSGTLNHDDFLRLFHRIDVSLDAFPCGGGTTTCESLWMGVPVVTLAGKFGVSRSGVSLLNSAGLPNLIAQSPMQYIDIAAGLASDMGALAALRQSLREQTQRSPLMDETGFTRAFQALLSSTLAAASAVTT